MYVHHKKVSCCPYIMKCQMARKQSIAKYYTVRTARSRRPYYKQRLEWNSFLECQSCNTRYISVEKHRSRGGIKSTNNRPKQTRKPYNYFHNLPNNILIKYRRNSNNREKHFDMYQISWKDSMKREFDFDTR